MKITFIPGDGIGPEVSGAARSCVDEVSRKHGFDIEWEECYAGQEAQEKTGALLPKETLASIRKNKVTLKGPLTTPVGEGFRSVNVELRQKFDLFANIRPVKLFPGVPSKYPGVDLVVIRENTEDIYAGVEFDKGTIEARDLINFAREKAAKELKRDSAIAFRPISAGASERIARFAFDYAAKKKRKKITVVHKANIMKFTDGLFLRSAQAVSKDYREIAFEERIIDNMCMQLIEKPELYDVLLCPNFYGDILSDLCAALAGGIGLAPSANVGKSCAIFEPVHGSAPKYAKLDKANPTACILSAALMLEHLGKFEAALELERALLEVIKEGKKVTYDLNPSSPSGTKAMTAEIIRKIK